MKVLVLHNQYLQRGGEDAVVAAEVELLRAGGVEVVERYWTNEQAGPLRVLGSLRMAAGSAWSHDSYRSVQKLCREHRPDVVHVHNFWMRLSPSAHAAARALGIATVQTIHNYRLLCANATFVRNGEICQNCLGKTPWQGVARRCYRGSAPASAAVVRMIAENRLRRTWREDVSAFIFPSRSCRDLHLGSGLPTGRLLVKPHFVPDPGLQPLAPSATGDVLFVGRLSTEKGVDVLLDAWRQVERKPERRLLIAGDGPLREELERQAADIPGVRFLGSQTPAEVAALIARARIVTVPSLGPEPFGRIVIESYAYGRPVVASGIGALTELVRHGATGMSVTPGDPCDLKGALDVLLANDALVDRLGRNARAEHIALYTPERNFRSLMDIYHAVMNRRADQVEALCRR